jgi:cytochrome c556
MYLKMLPLVLITFITTSSLLFANDVSEKLETGKTILNAIHSDEVKKIMQNLNNLIYEREYTELELKKLSHRQIELLVEEATTLTKTASNQANIISLQSLGEEEQLTFTAMTNQLREIAIELKSEIGTNHYKEIDALYIKLQSTCNTCHQLFREP